MHTLRSIGSAFCLALMLLVFAAPAAAQNWSELAAEDVVTIVTRNEDGSARETKIWIVTLDERGFVRTGNTRWFRNIERDPNVTLRSAGQEVAVRATPVEDEPLRARIEDAFRAKHGFTDRLRGWVVWGRPNILELERRAR
jgi:hypothetical protein